jgi:3-hydroxybutyryl-CoA dehydrogenase
MMKLEEIQNVAVIGAGTMGSSMALVFSQHGYNVKLYSRREETRVKAKSILMSSLATMTELGLLKKEEIDPIVARVVMTGSLKEAASDAHIICETVAERRDVKREMFDRLDKICPPETIFTSNTSSLNIFELAPEVRLPNTVIAHFFAPPHLVPLVEVVRGEKTRSEVMDLMMELLKKAGRTPVRMEKFISGFVINRLYRALGREAFFLLDHGYVTADQLDLAAKVALAPRMMFLGILQRYDFTGLDISWNNLQNPDFVDPPVDNQPKTLKELIEKGHLGVKTGKGFFDYNGRKLTDILKERDRKLIRVMQDLEMCLSESCAS